jgi:hypothetical protein
MKLERDNITNRSAYWSFHDTWRGWEDILGDGWTDEGFNRTAHENPGLKEFYMGQQGPGAAPPPPPTLPPIVQEALMSGGFTMSFSCGSDATLVKSVAYDPTRQLMLVVWMKSRTGARGGVPPGSTTVYDHVPQHVFNYLQDINKARGRVGEEVWKIIRGKSTPSLYPYSNVGDEQSV